MGVRVQQNTTKEENEEQLNYNTKRKLDYTDAKNDISGDDECLSLTPHVLEESKNYGRANASHRNTSSKAVPQLSQNPVNISRKTYNSSAKSNCPSTPPSNRRTVEDPSEPTPKMQISLDHKNTPSSYYKGSQSNYSQSDHSFDSQNPDEANYEDHGYFDIITDSETLDFLDYYFKSTPTYIPLSTFCTHLCTEYSDFLSQTQLSPSDLCEELWDKLEKSDGEISFNKLQVYTKDIGLSAYVENVCKEIRGRAEKEEKEQLTKDVFLQLAELNEELKEKDVELKHREARIGEWEKEVEDREKQVMARLQDGKWVVIIFS